MKALQLEQYMEHSGCDWTEIRVLTVSEDIFKLEKLATALIDESFLFVEQSRKIRYSRELKLNDKERHEEIAKLHSTFENISRYGIYCEIDGSETSLVIKDIQVI